MDSLPLVDKSLISLLIQMTFIIHSEYYFKRESEEKNNYIYIYIFGYLLTNIYVVGTKNRNLKRK